MSIKNISDTELLSVCNTKSRCLIEKAVEHGAQITAISLDPTTFSLSRGGYSVVVFKGQLPLNTKVSVLIANDKCVTKTLLSCAGLSTPRGFSAKSEKEALEKNILHKLRFPLVVKPIDGSYGIGITVGIRTTEELTSAIAVVQRAQRHSKMLKNDAFIVEEMALGRDYRILVLDDTVIACAERIPAAVTGNGKDTIAGLVEAFNISRPKSFQITISPAVEAFLKEQNFSMGSVLGKDQVAKLRKNANISMGGTPIDRTDEMSNYFKEICRNAARTIGLRFAGIDVYTEDISSNGTSEYAILEVNGNLINYNIHEKPIVSGKGVDVTGILIEKLLEK